MILALTPKIMVDIEGVNYRIDSETKQFGLAPHKESTLNLRFKDLGLVTYKGVEYYASLLERPVIELD